MAHAAECAKFFRQLLTFVRAPSRDNDMSALMRDGLRRRAADASQRVSDQNDGSSAMVGYTQRLSERGEKRINFPFDVRTASTRHSIRARRLDARSPY